MKNVLIILVFFISYNLVAQNISGFVFADINANGNLDKREAGIANISVSNGEQVVKTDAKGYYSLPTNDANFVFIAKPSEYAFVLDSDGNRIFYGKVQTNVQLNFPLLPSQKKENLHLLVIGDPQVYDTLQISYFERELNSINPATYDLALVLGDIVFDKLDLLDDMKKLMNSKEKPFYTVPGNHDINFDATTDKVSGKTYTEVFGPEYYSFSEGNVHFVLLDNIDFPVKNEAGRNTYLGRIGKKQLAWLENDLKFVPDDYTVVAAMHIPISSTSGYYAQNKLQDSTELLNVLSKRHEALIVTGHTHTFEQYFYKANNREIRLAIAGAACGSWWRGELGSFGVPEAICTDGSVKGYQIYNFDKKSYSFTYFPFFYDANYQFELEFENENELKPGSEIYVNVFNGNKHTKVEILLNNQLSLTAEQVTTTSVRARKNFDQAWNNWDWLSETPAEHFWKVVLPADCTASELELTVKVTDEFGNIYSQNRMLKLH